MTALNKNSRLTNFLRVINSILHKEIEALATVKAFLSFFEYELNVVFVSNLQIFSWVVSVVEGISDQEVMTNRFFVLDKILTEDRIHLAPF